MPVPAVVSEEVDIVSPDVRVEALPLQEFNEPFVLFVHEGRWSATVRGHLVPELRRLHIDPGVNGVQYREGASPNWTPTMSVFTARGYEYIRPEWGPEGRKYVRRTKVRSRSNREGWFYHDPWTLLHVGTDRAEFDEAKFNDWIWSLVDAEKIRGPAPYAVRAEIGRLEAEVARFDDRAHVSPTAKAEADKRRKAIAACEAYLARIDAPRQAEPAIIAEAEDVDLDDPKSSAVGEGAAQPATPTASPSKPRRRGAAQPATPTASPSKPRRRGVVANPAPDSGAD